MYRCKDTGGSRDTHGTHRTHGHRRAHGSQTKLTTIQTLRYMCSRFRLRRPVASRMVAESETRETPVQKYRGSRRAAGAKPHARDKHTWPANQPQNPKRSYRYRFGSEVRLYYVCEILLWNSHRRSPFTYHGIRTHAASVRNLPSSHSCQHRNQHGRRPRSFATIKSFSLDRTHISVGQGCRPPSFSGG